MLPLGCMQLVANQTEPGTVTLVNVRLYITTLVIDLYLFPSSVTLTISFKLTGKLEVSRVKFLAAGEPSRDTSLTG